MLHRFLGATGLKVSRLGLGTMTWGTDDGRARGGGAAAHSSSTRAAPCSTRPRPTARVRPSGLVGRLLGTRSSTGATSCSRPRAASPEAATVSASSTCPAGPARATSTPPCERLGVDHVDLWQLHTWSDDAPLDETLSALDFAVSSGRATVCRRLELLRVADGPGRHVPAGRPPGRARSPPPRSSTRCCSVGIEREVVPAVIALGLGILPWGPLGRGVLTGKYRTGLPADSRAASRRSERYVGEHLTPAAPRWSRRCGGRPRAST